MIQGDSSLNFSAFQKLYKDYPEKLFKYMCYQIKNLQRAASEAQEHTYDGGSVDNNDEKVSLLQEQVSHFKQQVKDQWNAMRELMIERDDV